MAKKATKTSGSTPARPKAPAANRRDAASLYSMHPSVAMVQESIARLKEKTGRSLDEWLRFIAKEGPKSEPDRRDWLKREHGLGTNYAWWLAERSFGKGEEHDDPEKYLAKASHYVETMYADKKAGLRPIHDRLVQLALALGKDAKVCPCATMVPLYREHVFAQIKPSTNTRLDLGLALARFVKEGRGKIPSRLIDTGGIAKRDRITHRIPLATLAEIDAEVERWLRIAYETDAPA
ncbi:MAG: DUF5655 domain-containing protein [Phycisphaerales bacterium]